MRFGRERWRRRAARPRAAAGRLCYSSSVPAHQERGQRALCGIALEIARAEPPLIVFEDRRHLIGALGDLVGARRLARRMPLHRPLRAGFAERGAERTAPPADEYDRRLRSADGVRVDHILIVVLLDVALFVGFAAAGVGKVTDDERR